MELPRPKLSETAKARVTRIYATFSAVMWKLIPVLIFALIFSQVAVLIDQNHYRNAPADDFLKYTEFSVQNARENEDVNFRVCRDRVSNIAYDGDLSIFIIANADKPNERRTQVYNRDIGGTIQNECENKVIRAADFRHAIGTYEMGFCVRFNVKYGFEKEACKTSNRYRIYSQPNDVENKIRDLEQQLKSAREQLGDATGNVNAPQDNSLAVPQTAQPQNATPRTDSQNTGGNNNQSNGNTGGTGNSGAGNSGTGVQPPTCVANVLGLGLVCGSDGLLSL